MLFPPISISSQPNEICKKHVLIVIQLIWWEPFSTQNHYQSSMVLDHCLRSISMMWSKVNIPVCFDLLSTYLFLFLLPSTYLISCKNNISRYTVSYLFVQFNRDHHFWKFSVKNKRKVNGVRIGDSELIFSFSHFHFHLLFELRNRD